MGFIEESGWPQVQGETSSVKFTIQSGPIKEFGVNGCQIDDVVSWAKGKIEEFNAAFPCRENSMVVTKLDEALLWLGKRKADREKRNVEGTNKAWPMWLLKWYRFQERSWRAQGLVIQNAVTGHEGTRQREAVQWDKPWGRAVPSEPKTAADESRARLEIEEVGNRSPPDERPR